MWLHPSKSTQSYWYHLNVFPFKMQGQVRIWLCRQFKCTAVTDKLMFWKQLVYLLATISTPTMDFQKDICFAVCVPIWWPISWQIKKIIYPKWFDTSHKIVTCHMTTWGICVRVGKKKLRRPVTWPMGNGASWGRIQTKKLNLSHDKSGIVPAMTAKVHEV